jgi:pyrroline-5-carboxylate reductase
MNLLVLGCGNMGSAIVEALAKQSEPLFEYIFLYDTNTEKMDSLIGEKIRPLRYLNEAPWNTFSSILIAVKPQDIDVLLESIRHFLTPQHLLISIAAGVRLERIQEKSGISSIIRVMPNTPALVGLGASGWLGSSSVSEDQKQLIVQLLKSFGVAIEVQDEDKLDAVTALSGSGPAYVFYFLEALTEAGNNLGLPPRDAYQLALQTLKGAAELANQNAKTHTDLVDLRINVTSKGGTTEKALEVFAKKGFREMVDEALLAAYQRAKEL